ncbi:MAG TPA: hypothetical protein VF013_05510 [Candidatus Limnocylindria bacterium]
MRPIRTLAAAGALLLAGCSLILPPNDPSPSEPAIGVGTATWALSADEEIGPETQSFTAFVTERDCASGRSSQGRIVGPSIDYEADAVVVTFGVRGLGGVQSCPSNPATRVEVRLREPLGQRALLDGGLGDRQEPPVCEASPNCI